MTIEQAEQKAKSFDIPTTLCNLTSGNMGLFISYERVIDGKAQVIPINDPGMLAWERYSKRYLGEFKQYATCTGELYEFPAGTV